MRRPISAIVSLLLALSFTLVCSCSDDSSSDPGGADGVGDTGGAPDSTQPDRRNVAAVPPDARCLGSIEKPEGRPDRGRGQEDEERPVGPKPCNRNGSTGRTEGRESRRPRAAGHGGERRDDAPASGQQGASRGGASRLRLSAALRVHVAYLHRQTPCILPRHSRSGCRVRITQVGCFNLRDAVPVPNL